MSLRLRLIVLTGLLTASAILVFALVFYLSLEDHLFDAVDTRLKERANLIGRMLAEDADAEAGTARIPLLVEFDSPGIYVELLGPDGQVQVASANLAGGRLPSISALSVSARAEEPSFATISAGGDEDLRLLVALAQPGGVLIVAESLEPLERTLSQARTLLLLFGSLALILVTGGAALLTGRALAPMAMLTTTAASIARTGNYHERVPAAGPHDEIGQLATTINVLIGTVERALGQQRQLLADTSHELRSPLTVVLANLDLLRRNMEQHDREICIGEAAAEAQRMRRLVNDLLLLAQGDALPAVARGHVQLNHIVEEASATAARQDSGCPIHTQADEAVVLGDAERLTQLIRNLLDNALRHTPAGTAIHVSLRACDDMAELSVADAGPGIAPEHLPQIWDRFYRVDKARTRALGGSGLGLAIVKYIAEAHGGSVDVTSELKRGTTFTVRLPLAAPADQALPVAARSGA